jgi:hypothetical protein
MVTNNELDQALAHISNLVNFAYEQGYHEHGYDPVEVVRTELARRSTSWSDIFNPCTSNGVEFKKDENLNDKASGIELADDTITITRDLLIDYRNQAFEQGVIEGRDQCAALAQQAASPAPAADERAEKFALNLAAAVEYDPQSFLNGAKWQAQQSASPAPVAAHAQQDAAPAGDGIRGPMTADQKRHARHLFRNAYPLGDDAIDDAIQYAAICGYVNGRLDFETPSAAPRKADAAIAGEHARDNCKLCLGAKGGVPGNENVIGGVVVCDYCTSTLMDMKAAGWFGNQSATSAADAKDTERWRFMMAVADNDDGPEANAMSLFARDADDNDNRPESVQMAEIVDKARAAIAASQKGGAA